MPQESSRSFLASRYFADTTGTIRAVGEQPTTGWSLFGMTFTELAHAVVVLGPQADVVIDHVTVEGQEVANSFVGFNLFNGGFPRRGVGWQSGTPAR